MSWLSKIVDFFKFKPSVSDFEVHPLSDIKPDSAEELPLKEVKVEKVAQEFPKTRPEEMVKEPVKRQRKPRNTARKPRNPRVK